MKITVFSQWEKLAKLIRSIAASEAGDTSRHAVNRVVAADGRATLADRAANILAVSGGTTTLTVPDIEPGKVREFTLRVAATGENTLVFAGAESFEGEPDALDAPGDGETAVYRFTETAGDVFLVTRQTVSPITGE